MKFQDEFTAKIRGCATSSATLSKFIESICKKLNILSITNKKEVVYNATNLDEKEQQEILKIYREQLIRVMNDLAIMRENAKEEYKKKQEERKAKLQEEAQRKEEVLSEFEDEDFAF